tara:strand:- start:3268 stop:3663 length:396 start_codon:yes stop_codon:yes gene_type:complete
LDEQVQSFIEELLGNYGWMFLAGFAALLFKSSISSAVEGFKVFAGNDLNTDDVVSFNGRPARVIRVGMWKTVFFIYDVDCSNGKPVVKGGSKMSIDNEKLKEHIIEKPLPMLDLNKYIQCDDNDKPRTPTN